MLKENQIVDFKNINFDYSLESVPSQFNEQKLIKTLEKLGIGRPSTFAYIVDIIQKRNYVNKTDIEGKKMEISNYRIAKSNDFAESSKVLIVFLRSSKLLFNSLIFCSGSSLAASKASIINGHESILHLSGLLLNTDVA